LVTTKQLLANCHTCPISDSSKAQLWLRAMHLPSCTKFQAVFLPQNDNLPVSTDFSGLKYANFSQKSSTKPVLLPNSPYFGSFGLILPIFCEMNKTNTCLDYLDFTTPTIN